MVVPTIFGPPRGLDILDDLGKINKKTPLGKIGSLPANCMPK
jgi:hypothetical protein